VVAVIVEFEVGVGVGVAVGVAVGVGVGVGEAVGVDAALTSIVLLVPKWSFPSVAEMVIDPAKPNVTGPVQTPFVHPEVPVFAGEINPEDTAKVVAVLKSVIVFPWASLAVTVMLKATVAVAVLGAETTK
jgi:hypothetical protein